MKKKEKKKSSILSLFKFLIVIGLLIILYSHFIGTKELIIREYSITNNKIPDSFNGYKIVHFSDLHYGSTIKDKEVKNLVKEINRLKPNLVVFTGDLIEEGYNMTEDNINNLSNELNNINANLKYYVRGNHDTNESFNKVIDNTSFIDFNNKNDLIYYEDNIPIRLVGLDDYLEFNLNIEEAFNYENDDIYTILFAHEPDLIDKLLDKNIDLMLSGHSHNGQIRLPFIGKIYTPDGSKKYYDEFYKINNTNLYISGGLGTSKIPFRLLVKPSFNFYRLYNN